MLKKTFLKTAIIISLLTGSALLNINAQVTIGETKVSEAFSVLELISSGNNGMRLPQMTTAQRDAVAATFNGSPEAMGLTIFNTSTKCVETWNGLKWISVCSTSGTGTGSDCTAFNFTLELATASSVSAYANYKVEPNTWKKNGTVGADLYMVDKIVVSTSSTPVVLKWAEGTKDKTWFESNGTSFTLTDGIPVFTNGTFSVYCEDEDGCGLVKTITTTNLRDGSTDKPFLLIDYVTANTLASTVTGIDTYILNYLQTEDPSKHYELYEDISMETALNPQYADANIKGNWLPVRHGVFSGSFEGNGNTIYNMIIEFDDTDDFVPTVVPGISVHGTGMFSVVFGTVSNLTLAGGSVTNNYTNHGNEVDFGFFLGGIAGISGGTITNCHNTGSVIRAVAQNGIMAIVGGIAGGNVPEAIIENCSNTGTVSGILGLTVTGGITGSNGGKIETSYNTGNVSGSFGAGGIVGVNTSSAEIISCYNTGNISTDEGNAPAGHSGGIAGGYNEGGGKISNCYNTGNIIGRNSAGGMVGCMDYESESDIPSVIENCYNTGNITATSSGHAAGGIVGIAYRERNCNITNCYALNSSITKPSTAVGRIIGSFEDYNVNINLSNNYAINTMKINGSTVAEDDGTGINGKNINFTEATDNADIHYVDFGTWNFSDVWTFDHTGATWTVGSEVNLPILKAFNNTDFPNAVQNPYIIEDVDVPCVENPHVAGEPLVAGSNSYATDQYGKLVWMTENSKEGDFYTDEFGGGESDYLMTEPLGLCTDEDGEDEPCQTYFGNKSRGAYYSLNNLANACPTGWHLPTKAEFQHIIADASENPAPWLIPEAYAGFRSTIDDEDDGDFADFWVGWNIAAAYAGNNVLMIVNPNGKIIPGGFAIMNYSDMSELLMERIKVSVRCIADHCFTEDDLVCTENPHVAGEPLVAGSNTYATDQHGKLVWMVENSREGTPFAKFFGDNEKTTGAIFSSDGCGEHMDDCEQFDGGDRGFYYRQADLAGACPSGWHLPDEVEFRHLMANGLLTSTKWTNQNNLAGQIEAHTDFPGIPIWKGYNMSVLFYGKDNKALAIIPAYSIADVVDMTELADVWAAGDIQAYAISVRCVKDHCFTEDDLVCKENPHVAGEPLVGQNGTYATAQYGDLVWMVENSKEGTTLATYFGEPTTEGGIDTQSGFCVDEDGEECCGANEGGANEGDEGCSKNCGWCADFHGLSRGAYYLKENFATACPNGWHLPTAAEFQHLIDNIADAPEHWTLPTSQAGIWVQADAPDYTWLSWNYQTFYAGDNGVALHSAINMGISLIPDVEGMVGNLTLAMSVRCVKDHCLTLEYIPPQQIDLFLASQETDDTNVGAARFNATADFRTAASDNPVFKDDLLMLDHILFAEDFNTSNIATIFLYENGTLLGNVSNEPSMFEYGIPVLKDGNYKVRVTYLDNSVVEGSVTTSNNIRNGSPEKPFLIVDYTTNRTYSDNKHIDLRFSTLNMLRGNSTVWFETTIYNNALLTAEQMLDKHFELYEDIDLDTQDNSLYYDSNIKGNWLPVNGIFSGSFDGKGHTIHNMNIDVNDDDDIAKISEYNMYGIGMFAGVSGNVRNTTLDGGSVTDGYMNLAQETYVGSIAGVCLGGTIKNCRNTGTVKKLENNLSGYYPGVGGIVGAAGAYGTVENCSNTGTVETTGNLIRTGGIAGVTGIFGKIENCYNEGNILSIFGSGGIVGQSDSDSEIINCYNIGDVSTKNDVLNFLYAGGIVGITSNINGGTGGSITKCYNTGNITSTAFAGGINGMTSAATTIGNCYNTGSVTGDIMAGGIVCYVQFAITVENCYNTGNLTSTIPNSGGTGGIVGGGNDIDITNCYALNSSIMPFCYAGRILGISIGGTTLSNNYAINTMKVNNATPTADDGTGKNGLNITFTEATDNADIHYVDFGTWNFSDVWTFDHTGTTWAVGSEVNLPILRAFNNTDFPNAVQNPYIEKGEEEAVIGCLIWSDYNVAEPGTFTTTIEDPGMYYQWNSKIGWTPDPAGINPPTPSDGVSVWNESWDGNGASVWAPENDPCPDDWRLPTFNEMLSLAFKQTSAQCTTINGKTMHKAGFANGVTLLFPAAGVIKANGLLYEQGCDVYFHTTTNGNGNGVLCTDFENHTDDNYWWCGMWIGRSVRCVKGVSDETCIPITTVSITPNTTQIKELDASGNPKTTEDESTTFTATVSTELELLVTYEWYVNGVLQEEETSNTFIFETPTGSAGTYTVYFAAKLGFLGNIRLNSEEVTVEVTMPVPCIAEEGVEINGVIWAASNVDAFGTFACAPDSYGMFYQWNRPTAWNSTDLEVYGWDNTYSTSNVWEAQNDPCPEGWRIPTAQEIWSLINVTGEYVTNEWTIYDCNNVNGVRFTDKTTNNTIFLPAPGARYTSDGNLMQAGIAGCYWSDMVINIDDALGLLLYSGFAVGANSKRAGGFSVRCVKEPDPCEGLNCSVAPAGGRVTAFVNVMYDFQHQTLEAYPTSGGDVINYQWQVSTDNTNFVNIAGAPNSAFYTVPVDFIHKTEYNGIDELYFRCVLTNPAGSTNTISIGIEFIRTNTGGYGVEGGVRYLTVKRGGSLNDGKIRVALINVGASETDGIGLGDFYQWGRVADGHQVTVWSKNQTTRANQIIPMTGNGATSAVISFANRLNGSTSNTHTANGQIPDDGAAGYGKFITIWPGNWGDSSNDTWGNVSKDRAGAPVSLDGTAPVWTSRAQNNNPCPAGWRVPSRFEQWDIYRGDGSNSPPSVVTPSGTAYDNTNNAWRFRPTKANTNAYGGAVITNDSGEKLFMPAAGYRINDSGVFDGAGPSGYYWSSTYSDANNAYRLYFMNNFVSAGGQDGTRPYGYSVRCVAEVPTFSVIINQVDINGISGTYGTVTGAGNYAENKTVNLTATPTGGSNMRFKYWEVVSGGATLNGTVVTAANSFSMPNENVVLKAVFAVDKDEDFTLLYDWYDLAQINNNLNKNFKLTKNLDETSGFYETNLGGWDMSGATPAGWRPLGSGYSTSFIGKFDGAGYKISNLWINRPSAQYVGLFGFVKNPGIIKNLGVNTATAGIIASWDVGCVVGYNDGTVENCFSTGVVTGKGDVGGIVGINTGIIVKCYNTSAATNTQISQMCGAGGIAGSNISGVIGGMPGGGGIKNCYNMGVINGNYIAGGISSYNTGTIENCYNTEEVMGVERIGGIAGWHNDGTIKNCYNTGSISGNTLIGGISGWNSDGSTIRNCYNTGAISGEYSVGGIIGDGGSCSIENCYALNSTVAGSDCCAGRVGWRVIGYQNNYALETMKVNGSVISTVDYHYGLDKRHGLNITATEAIDKTNIHYTTSPSNWDFSNVWTFDHTGATWAVGSEVNLPILKAFTKTDFPNAVQNPNIDPPCPCTVKGGVKINGVCWATRNVDAFGNFTATPADYGMLYQWNRPTAWNNTDATVMGWNSANATGTTWATGNDPCPAGWRVPTMTELNDLRNPTYITNEWTTENNGFININGKRFTEIANGNSIFLPAGGSRNCLNSAISSVGSFGYYWSSICDGAACTTPATSSYNLRISSGVPMGMFSDRADGCSVRCVAE